MIIVLISVESRAIPLTIGMLVGGELLATSSTMFANPQVTLARMFTYCDAGISVEHGIIFIFVQLSAAVFATYVGNFFVVKNDDLTKPLVDGN
jgi:hypothetical protein